MNFLGVWEGCRKRCSLDVLRGVLKVEWDVEKFRAWPIVSMAYCKCICKKTISLCSLNSKYGELVRVLSGGHWTIGLGTWGTAGAPKNPERSEFLGEW